MVLYVVTIAGDVRDQKECKEEYTRTNSNCYTAKSAEININKKYFLNAGFTVI